MLNLNNTTKLSLVNKDLSIDEVLYMLKLSFVLQNYEDNWNKQNESSDVECDDINESRPVFKAPMSKCTITL